MNKSYLFISCTLFIFLSAIYYNFSESNFEKTTYSSIEDDTCEGDVTILQLPEETECINDEDISLLANVTLAPECTTTILLNFSWTRNGELIRNVFLEQDQLTDELTNLGDENLPISEGEYTVTVTNDNYDTTFSFQDTFVVTGDTILPEINCVGVPYIFAEVPENTQFEIPDYIVTGMVTFSDNCEATSVQIPTPGTLVDGGGVYPITITVTDSSGNMSICSFSQVVNEIETICEGDVTILQLPEETECINDEDISLLANVTLAPECTTTVLLNFSWTRNGELIRNVFLEQDQLTDELTNLGDESLPISEGEYTATIVNTNENNPFSFQDTFVVIGDTISPEINCSEDLDVEIPENTQFGIPDYVATGVVTFSDNCEVTSTQTPAPGTLVGEGMHTITIEVADNSGNTTTCSFSQEVNEIETICEGDVTILQLPEETECINDEDISLLANVTLAPECTTTVLLNFSWTRNEELIRNVFLDQDQLTDELTNLGDENSPISEGEYTVTIVNTNENNPFTFQDTFVVTGDTIFPEINCSEDLIVEIPENTQFEISDYIATGVVTFSDNCEVTSTQTPASGTLVGEGMHTITIEVTDNSGNTTTCMFLLTVEETLSVEDFNDPLQTVRIFNTDKGIITINNPNAVLLKEMLMYDITGKEVMSIGINANNSNTLVDVSQLSSGVYFATIEEANKKVVYRVLIGN